MALRVEPARGLTYEDLYPNTLLDFHTQDGQLKYDWHLSDPQASQLFDGGTMVLQA